MTLTMVDETSFTLVDSDLSITRDSDFDGPITATCTLVDTDFTCQDVTETVAWQPDFGCFIHQVLLPPKPVSENGGYNRAI